MMGLLPEFETQREKNIYRLIRRRTRRRNFFALHTLAYSLGLLVSAVAIITIFRNSIRLGFDPFQGVSSTAAFAFAWTLVWIFHLVQKLIVDMRENINTYWASFITKFSRITYLWTDYGVQWTVLGVLRQFYTFKENDITSKAGAGEYALTHLPARWHRLIQEALNIREQKHRSLYTFKLVRSIEAFLFLRDVIHRSNALNREDSKKSVSSPKQ